VNYLRFIPPILALFALLFSANAAPAPKTGTVGEPLVIKAVSKALPEMVYYIFDWGDGTWTPSARVNGDAGMDMEHVWRAPGEYPARWMTTSLSGRSTPWRPVPVTIKGPGQAPRWDFLAPRTIFTGSKSVNATRREGSTRLLSSSNWQSPVGDSPLVRNWLALDFGAPRSVGWVVLTRHPKELFPEFFSIEYSLDGGIRWHPLMSAVFSFFPDPGKNTVWIPLHGVMATSIRVTSPRGTKLSNGKYGMALGNLQAVAGPAPLFSSTSPKEAVKFGLWNNLWLNYGLAANEVLARNSPWWQTDRPLDGGAVGIPSCEWLFWDASKITWMPDHPDAGALKDYIRNNPVGADGYAWPSGGSEKHLGHSRHTVTSAIYPMAVAQVYLQTRDRAFLESKDPKTGETVLDKARRSVDYLIGTLGGSGGLLNVTDPEIDGTPSSKGNNYWDFWLFGGRSAYDNAFFYEMLRWMGELEEALGNGERADSLRQLRPLVKQKFNETFWNGDKGRYVGWVDGSDKAYDYGFTFVNLPAVAWGLADEDRARKILDWLDGKRTVEGDSSTGKDIYSFGFAPRSNTVDASTGSPPMVNTWDGALNTRPGGNAAFGLQIQNGGAVFYVSYYDLMARLRAEGIGNAMSRMEGILAEAAKDEIRRDPANMEGHSDIVGILREFPESGLVPLFFLDGVMGLQPLARGLRIHPTLPPGWKDAAVGNYAFAGKKFQIVADAGITAPLVSRNGELQVLRLPAGGDWLLTPEGTVEPWKETEK